MANTQTKLGFWRKLYRWTGRHKIKSSLCLLVLAGMLYAGGSWVVLQAQIRAERARFMAAGHLVEELDRVLYEFSPTSDKLTKTCTYSDNGAVFSTSSLGCGIDVDANMQGVSIAKAGQVTSSLLASTHKFGLNPRSDKSDTDTYRQTKYTFRYEGLACGFSTLYYADSVPQVERYSQATQKGSDLLTTVSCSGVARSEYFPVTQD